MTDKISPAATPSDELRFSALFSQAAAGLAELDPQGHFTLVNDGFCALVGRSRDYLLTLRMHDITHPDDLAHNMALFDAAATRGEPYRIEKRYVRPDGSDVWVDKSVSVIRTPDGGIARLFAITQDISERRAAEATAAEQARNLEILNRTGTMIAAELDLERVVQQVTDAGVALTGAHFGAFFYNVIDDAGGSYMLYALSGVSRSAFEGFPMPRATDVFRPTFLGEGVVRSDDIREDARYGRSAPFNGMPAGHLPVVSYLAVPVVSRSGEVIGGLFFGHPKEGRFTAAHETLMTGISAQAAIAIDNARLYQSAQLEVTERRAAESARRESEDRFQLIADSAPTPMWVTKPDGKRAFVNKAYIDFLGVPFERALDFDWRERLHPDDVARILEEQIAGERSLQVFTLEARYRDTEGNWRWLRSASQPRWGANGEHLGFIGVAFDITEAKRAEADLRQLNELLEQRVAERTTALEALYNRTPTLLHSQLPDGRLVSVSDRWLEFMGYEKREDVIGRPVTEFLASEGDDRVRAQRWLDVLADSRLTDHSGFDDIEYRARKRSGEIADVMISGRVERDALGRTQRTLVAMTDITARKRAEDALRQAQKMEAVGQLTGGIAHDFNNLLTIIRSSADLLKRGGLPEERRTRYIDAIAGTADRAAALTGQLLAFARRQPLRPETFDAGNRVESLRELIVSALGGRVSLSLEIGCEACLVEADPNQFDTALLNLVSNARDAMEDGGRLSIRVFAESDTLIGIDVADSGEGIATALLPHIFEPFYTTKDVGKGTGLGLSQVYGFAKQSGGEVRVDSQVGVGTTFTFSLPRARGRAASAAVAKPAQGAQRPLRILVVEDNAAVGDNAVQVLRDLGHTPVLAKDARAALDRFGPRGEEFDAVFSDVVMPGMSGLELAAELRRLAPKMPIVLTSGYSDALVAGSGSEFELVSKPYSVDQVAEALARVTSA